VRVATDRCMSITSTFFEKPPKTTHTFVGPKDHSRQVTRRGRVPTRTVDRRCLDYILVRQRYRYKVQDAYIAHASRRATLSDHALLVVTVSNSVCFKPPTRQKENRSTTRRPCDRKSFKIPEVREALIDVLEHRLIECGAKTALDATTGVKEFMQLALEATDRIAPQPARKTKSVLWKEDPAVQETARGYRIAMLNPRTSLADAKRLKKELKRLVHAGSGSATPRDSG
jgi:hypothetical protein